MQNLRLRKSWSCVHSKLLCFLCFSLKMQIILGFSPLRSLNSQSSIGIRINKLYLQNLCTNLENISETFHNAISRNDCETSLKNLTEAVRHAPTCREFWDHLKSLGPKRKHIIPCEVYDEDGNVRTDRSFVDNSWTRDFSNLYNAQNSQEFDDQFYDIMLQHKTFLEDNMKKTL